MTVPPPETISDSRFAALREAYAAALPAKGREIALLWEEARGAGSRPALERLRTAAHRLVGSGETYGFAPLTAAARALEAALVEPLRAPALRRASDMATIQRHVDELCAWLLAPHDLEAAPCGIEAALLPRGDADGAPLRVLIVDDDPDVARALGAWLGGHGYAVASVGSGEEAIARLENGPADLLFLDALMPGINGLQVIEHVRDAGLDLDIILTTAHGSEEIAVSAMRRGADDYLRKPIDTPDFRAALERAVSRLALRRRNAALRRQLDEKRRQLEVELARAARVQADLLPRAAPDLEGYELAARCIPAREVGGDFYDWHVPAAGLLNLTFGDVMGKGMPAALLMSTVRAVFRAVARQTSPLTNMRYAVGALEPDLDRAGSFVTIVHAQLDTTAHRLTYVDAGHGLGVVRRADGRIEELGMRGVPVGVPAPEPYAEGTVRLEVGDALVLFSDGLLDPWPLLARGPAAALGDILTGVGSAAAVVDRLLALPALVGPCSDDLTVVALMRR